MRNCLRFFETLPYRRKPDWPTMKRTTPPKRKGLLSNEDFAALLVGVGAFIVASNAAEKERQSLPIQVGDWVEAPYWEKVRSGAWYGRVMAKEGRVYKVKIDYTATGARYRKGDTIDFLRDEFNRT